MEAGQRGDSAMKFSESKPLRIAMLGMIPGNGHPFSWSAIINGFDPKNLDACPYGGIRDYLGKRDPREVRIPYAKVTHLWTDDSTESEAVAKFAGIPNIVQNPCDVAGEVDAIIIATDDGDDHIRRVEPLLSANVPIFVDKPLATNLPDLRRFAAWRNEGHRIVSSSGLRYSPELDLLRETSWQWVTTTTFKTWERYGIHALEPVASLLGPGFESLSATKLGTSTLFTIHHRSGTVVSLAVLPEALASAFVIHAYGREHHASVALRDTYSAFRSQMDHFLGYAAGMRGEHVAFSETVELMAVLIAGRESLRSGGDEVQIAPLLEEASAKEALR